RTRGVRSSIRAASLRGRRADIAVATRLGTKRGPVARWRARLLAARLDGLGDDAWPGGPSIAGARRAGISSASVHRRAFGLQPWRTENVQISPGPLLAGKIRDVAGLYPAPGGGAAGVGGGVEARL